MTTLFRQIAQFPASDITVSAMDARRLALIARVTGVCPRDAAAMDAWQKTSRDEGEVMPSEYNAGRNAACFALLHLSRERLCLFWFGLMVIACLPMALLLKVIL